MITARQRRWKPVLGKFLTRNRGRALASATSGRQAPEVAANVAICGVATNTILTPHADFTPFTRDEI